MAIDRVATFQAFIAKNPNDPFPRYGLAMEQRARGNLEESAATFAALTAEFPNYVPTYLMAGGVLAQLGRRDQAGQCYRRGIEVASVSDPHAKKELVAALLELETADE